MGPNGPSEGGAATSKTTQALSRVRFFSSSAKACAFPGIPNVQPPAPRLWVGRTWQFPKVDPLLPQQTSVCLELSVFAEAVVAADRERHRNTSCNMRPSGIVTRSQTGEPLGLTDRTTPQWELIRRSFSSLTSEDLNHGTHGSHGKRPQTPGESPAGPWRMRRRRATGAAIGTRQSETQRISPYLHGMVSVVEGVCIPLLHEGPRATSWSLVLLPPHQPVAADGESPFPQPLSQPCRVPIVAVSSRRPCFSSCAVSRANLARRGWPGGRKVSLRWRTGGLVLVA